MANSNYCPVVALTGDLILRKNTSTIIYQLLCRQSRRKDISTCPSPRQRLAIKLYLQANSLEEYANPDNLEHRISCLNLKSHIAKVTNENHAIMILNSSRKRPAAVISGDKRVDTRTDYCVEQYPWTDTVSINDLDPNPFVDYKMKLLLLDNIDDCNVKNQHIITSNRNNIPFEASNILPRRRWDTFVCPFVLTFIVLLNIFRLQRRLFHGDRNQDNANPIQGVTLEIHAEEMVNNLDLNLLPDCVPLEEHDDAVIMENIFMVPPHVELLVETQLLDMVEDALIGEIFPNLPNHPVLEDAPRPLNMDETELLFEIFALAPDQDMHNL